MLKKKLICWFETSEKNEKIQGFSTWDSRVGEELTKLLSR
jgi:hypothetical protein